MMRKYMTLGGLLVGLLVVVAAVGGGAPRVQGWNETHEDDQTGGGATPQGEIPLVESESICLQVGDPGSSWLSVCPQDGEGWGCTIDHVEFENGVKVHEVHSKCTPDKSGDEDGEDCDFAEAIAPELCDVGGNVTIGGNGTLTSWGVASSTSATIEVTPANIAPAPVRPDPRNFWTLR